MTNALTKITVPDDWKIHHLVDNDISARESCYRYLEYNTTSIDTKNTYRRAITRMLKYCESQGIVDLLDVEAGHIKDYIRVLRSAGKNSAAHTAFYSSKAFFQQCVDDGYLSSNPCGSIKEKFPKPKRGATQVLSPSQINQLILSIPCLDGEESPKESDMRDRALIALMAYTFARIGGALSTRIRDFKYQNDRYWLRMVEKGDKKHTVYVPQAAAEKIVEYIEYADLTKPHDWLFQSANRNGKMSGRPYDRSNSREMIKRRSIAVFKKDLKVKNHTLRATGITNALMQGISFDIVQDMANHADGNTTKLYDKSPIERLIEAMDDFDYEEQDGI